MTTNQSGYMRLLTFDARKQWRAIFSFLTPAPSLSAGGAEERQNEDQGLGQKSRIKMQKLKRDGAHAHEHADSGYGAPPATYEEPAASYGAPAPSYGAPETGYGPPAETYGVPSYEEEPLPDLTPIIVGILVLTGLSLLFPTFVSLSTVRRKRHADDGKN